MGVNHSNIQWSYCGDTGPDHWAALSPHFSDCAGEKQSPIAISQEHTKDEAHSLVFNYSDVTIRIRKVTANYQCDVHSNMHSYVDLELDQTAYELVQFHFHAHSEHRINDSYYPLELHLVHRRSDDDIVVVAVMLEEGADNETLNVLLSDFQVIQQVIRIGDPAPANHSLSPFPIKELLPTNKSYYRYAGSLTTPPCSEVVKWIVMKEPITISSPQIEKFSHLLKDNYRPLQEGKGRQVYHAK